MKLCAKCGKSDTRRWYGPLCRSCYDKQYRLENPDVIKAREKRHHKSRYAKKEYREKRSEYEKNNRLKFNKSNNSWRRRNLGYMAFMAATRRNRKTKATPSWLTKEQLNQIKEIYENCPPGHHVDHIIPLKAINPATKEHVACGLHVPWNLQYLSALENIRKKNRL